jgi:hypothetical protein
MGAQRAGWKSSAASRIIPIFSITEWNGDWQAR